MRVRFGVGPGVGVGIGLGVVVSVRRARFELMLKCSLRCHAPPKCCKVADCYLNSQAYVKERIERTKSEKEKDSLKNELIRIKKLNAGTEAEMKNFQGEVSATPPILISPPSHLPSPSLMPFSVSSPPVRSPPLRVPPLPFFPLPFPSLPFPSPCHLTDLRETNLSSQM